MNTTQTDLLELANRYREAADKLEEAASILNGLPINLSTPFTTTIQDKKKPKAKKKSKEIKFNQWEKNAIAAVKAIGESTVEQMTDFWNGKIQGKDRVAIKKGLTGAASTLKTKGEFAARSASGSERRFLYSMKKE